jgi:hypothetical protein
VVVERNKCNLFFLSFFVWGGYDGVGVDGVC